MSKENISQKERNMDKAGANIMDEFGGNHDKKHGNKTGEPKTGRDMESGDRVSIRGRTARRMVKLANHFPVPGGLERRETIRQRLNEREKKWECPEGLVLKEIAMEHFNMELLTGTDTVSDGIILQLHGGGYYRKMHNTYRATAGLYRELSRGFDVLSIDYRVAPKHPFPAALEDALAAYEWILTMDYNPDKIFVVGDSAGGGLALALCLYLRDYEMRLPRGIITMSAWTDLTKSGESYHENFDIDPIFGGSTDTLVYMDGYYKDLDPEEPYISPINGDFTGFPPMLMQVGEYEMLLSDTLTIVEKAKKSGVRVKGHIYKGMFHVFQLGLLLYPESREAWKEAGVFIRKLSKSEAVKGKKDV